MTMYIAYIYIYTCNVYSHSQFRSSGIQKDGPYISTFNERADNANLRKF